MNCLLRTIFEVLILFTRIIIFYYYVINFEFYVLVVISNGLFILVLQALPRKQKKIELKHVEI